MFSVSLRMPNWIGTRSNSSIGYHRDGRISEHHAWEFQTGYIGWGNLLMVSLDLDWCRGDHAGPAIEITLLGLWLRLDCHDTRHWDDESNAFRVYGPAYDAEIAAHYEREKASELRRAYALVAADAADQAAKERAAYLETPEGKAEALAERERLLEAKRLRGEEHRRRNLVDQKAPKV